MVSPAPTLLRNRFLLAAVSIVVLLGIAVALAVSGAREEKRDVRLFGIELPGSGSLIGAYERGEGPSDGKAGSDGKLTAAGDKGSSDGGSGESGSEEDGKSGNGKGDGKDSGDDPKDDPKDEPADEMKVKVLLWNDTLDKPAEGLAIGIEGQRMWTPDSDAKRASGVVGPIPYEEQAALVIYPDGPDGKKIVVELTVDRGMLEASERDAVHVEVNDTNVRVLGNPVENFDRSYPRF